jgi:hypothetical protein
MVWGSPVAMGGAVPAGRERGESTAPGEDVVKLLLLTDRSNSSRRAISGAGWLLPESETVLRRITGGSAPADTEP